MAGLLASCGLIGCGSTRTERLSSAELSTAVDGLDAPTQIVDGPDGSLLVAQLAGEEADGAGQVILIEPQDNNRRVLLSGLDKPTGVGWFDGSLWVMTRRSLLRASWDGDGEPGPIDVVLDELPFNGRSEGTLSILPDGRLLYATTGSIAGGTVVDGSGVLWVFEPISGTSLPVAVGAKNAYAHALLDNGDIVTTEIGDAAEPPLEELNVIARNGQPEAGWDLGWPDCPGDTSCDGVVDPVALFDVRSTPTGVAVIGDDAYVALFVPGTIVRVSLVADRSSALDRRSAPEVIAEGLRGPHSLLIRDDELWVSEHFADRVVRIPLRD